MRFPSLARVRAVIGSGCFSHATSKRGCMLVEAVMEAKANREEVTVSKVKEDDKERLHETVVTTTTKTFSGKFSP